METEKKEKFYVQGFRGFKKRDNAPEWIVGSLLISIDEFKDFLDTTKVQSVMSEYSIVASAIRDGTVFSQSYVENDVVVDVELPLSHAQQLAQYIYEVPHEPEHIEEPAGE